LSKEQEENKIKTKKTKTKDKIFFAAVSVCRLCKIEARHHHRFQYHQNSKQQQLLSRSKAN
jgi:hypothetical protein